MLQRQERTDEAIAQLERTLALAPTLGPAFVAPPAATRALAASLRAAGRDAEAAALEAPLAVAPAEPAAVPPRAARRRTLARCRPSSPHPRTTASTPCSPTSTR